MVSILVVYSTVKNILFLIETWCKIIIICVEWKFKYFMNYNTKSLLPVLGISIYYITEYIIYIGINLKRVYISIKKF